MPTNIVPSRDGEVNLYISEEAQKTEWWEPRKAVIFINGMKNSGENHRDSAVALSLVQMCPVIGVYNLSDGFIADLGQCIADKFQFHGPMAQSSRSALKHAVENNEDGLRAGQLMEAVLVRNPAALAMFRVLREAEHRYTPVFAHSQGNLILSNALEAVGAVDGPEALHRREIRTFGSPCRNWPREIDPIECGFTMDPVTWLSGFDWSFEISKVGWPSGTVNPISHAFIQYLNNDAAFIVNRFRWGSFGMTLSMDEKGLARALVAMGRNMPRVHAVFRYLRFWHPGDSDEVAMHYVELSRRSHRSAAIFQSVKAEPTLHRLLIDLMERGWTTDRERAAITYLESI